MLRATMLPELSELQAIVAAGDAHLQQRTLCEVAVGDTTYPVLAITLGNPSPEVPAVGFFGGVHGLERIGAEVVIAHLASLVMRLRWDSSLHRQLEALRLVFVPVVNPGGMAQATRANPNGVDLMRNAPIDADDSVAFLVGGPSPGQFSIVRSNDFDVSDAVLLPSGDLLVLERKFSLFTGVGVRIRRVKLADIAPGALVDGPAIFSADLGQEIDNLEGIDAHVTPDGETVLTLVSDDNFSMIQRTLLLQFTMLE